MKLTNEVSFTPLSCSPPRSAASAPISSQSSTRSKEPPCIFLKYMNGCEASRRLKKRVSGRDVKQSTTKSDAALATATWNHAAAHHGTTTCLCLARDFPSYIVLSAHCV